MITQRKTANAVGGTTARACESCLRKRARWYCAADEAFLCQGCDASVHSANQLASRHERIRLDNAFFKSSTGLTVDNCQPAWHQGFTRKARTPRHPKSKWLHTAPKHEEEKLVNSFPLVPEISGEDECLNDDDGGEELLYRVPVFDPFTLEFCNTGNETENLHAYEKREETYLAENGQDEAGHIDDIHGFFPPDDMDLLESLLGTGTEDEPCGIEGLGFIDCKDEDDTGLCFDGNKVKVEGDDEVGAILAYNMDSAGHDMTRETLDWNFDYESPVNGEEDQEEEHKVEVIAEEAKMIESRESKEVRNKIILNLNYEGVISSWANKGSPWTTGIRPEFNSDDCWPDFMGTDSPGMNRPYAGMGSSDGGRQARVSRYREKRRTRLFSKKIRYEVRKLNAEKRPRMKGRFVKRTSFAVASSPNFPLVHMINK